MIIPRIIIRITITSTIQQCYNVMSAPVTLGNTLLVGGCPLQEPPLHPGKEGSTKQ